MVDEQKLRQLAEAATPGPWEMERDTETDVFSNMWPNIQAGTEQIVGNEGFFGDMEVNVANAKFVAAANPAAVLSLLDELQTLREERTALLANEQNLQAAVKQARIDALEEAKQAVSAEEILEAEDNFDDAYNCGVLGCVRAIESLKGTP